MDDQFDFEIGIEPRKPGRPKKQQTTANQQPMDINISTNTYREPIEHNTNQELLSARKFEDELTPKEIAFMEAFLLGRVTKDQAMITAGYGHLHQDTRYRIAAKIIEKYERRADDRRNLFRAAGAGELTICLGLLEIAQGSYPAGVRRAAWADLASCLGLKSEQIESFQGVSLVVYGQEEARRLGIKDEDSPATPALPPPIQTIRISK
jgi:hypothetical protein